MVTGLAVISLLSQGVGDITCTESLRIYYETRFLQGFLQISLLDMGNDYGIRVG